MLYHDTLLVLLCQIILFVSIFPMTIVALEDWSLNLILNLLIRIRTQTLKSTLSRLYIIQLRALNLPRVALFLYPDSIALCSSNPDSNFKVIIILKLCSFFNFFELIKLWFEKHFYVLQCRDGREFDAKWFHYFIYREIERE